jgi:ribonuclease D|tara:strand:+ start:974 stop:2038 length:1065 start_codon:yes stop_codon:yes gene_type:complete
VIDKEENLKSFTKCVREAKWLALDTEADSLHAYPEKLCLIQVSLPGHNQLVDPLAGMDLSDFLQAINQHTLLMHGADYDIRLFKNGQNFVPNRIFDTMLAARLTGRTRFGLSNLVKDILGVQLEKTSQKANWARRPLTAKMEDYARNDTIHLRALVDVLEEDLRKMNRAQWHLQECARMVRDNSATTELDPNQVWRIKGAAKLPPRGLAVLREIWQWRETEARKRNRPPFFILSPDTMIKISVTATGKNPIDQLLPRRMPNHRKASIIRSVETGMQLNDCECPPQHKAPPRKHISPVQKKRFTEIQERRDRHADNLQIDPTIIASRSTMIRLACGAVDVFDVILPWQRELLEDD